MPDYCAYVTFTNDPYMWGSMFPMGRFVCTFQEFCKEWSGGRSMLCVLHACGYPVEVHVERIYIDDSAPRAVARMSYRDIRTAGRAALTEEVVFATCSVDVAEFDNQLVQNQKSRMERRQ